MSKGYWVVRANISNSEEYSKYVEMATNVVDKFNGRFLIRAGEQIEFENSGFERTVVVEFDSYESAIECYSSKDYQLALKYANNSSQRYFSIVRGI